MRLVKNKYHVQSFPSFLYSKQTEKDPGVQELEALIDTIQKQLKDHSCKDDIREAFQIYDKEASGYVDRDMFFKICESLNVPVDDSLVKEVSMNYSSELIAETKHWSFFPKGNYICISLQRTQI